MKIPAGKQLRLIHTGRSSGKEFSVTVWYAQLDGDLWVGSLDDSRNWVRNMRASGRVKVDFGDGPIQCECKWADDEGWERGPETGQRFRDAIQAKYPLMSRVIRLLQRGGNPVACRLRPV